MRIPVCVCDVTKNTYIYLLTDTGQCELSISNQTNLYHFLLFCFNAVNTTGSRTRKTQIRNASLYMFGFRHAVQGSNTESYLREFLAFSLSTTALFINVQMQTLTDLDTLSAIRHTNRQSLFLDRFSLSVISNQLSLATT